MVFWESWIKRLVFQACDLYILKGVKRRYNNYVKCYFIYSVASKVLLAECTSVKISLALKSSGNVTPSAFAILTMMVKDESVLPFSIPNEFCVSTFLYLGW